VRRILFSMLSLVSVGCMRAPSAPMTQVPPIDSSQTQTSPARTTSADRPMPRDVYETRLPPPPFEDAPMLSEPAPEQPAFVDTYNKVGRPRISVVIERTGAANEAPEKMLDYDALRTQLTDWLACGGKVTMVASADDKEADQTADVAIRVQAHAAEQTEQGPRVRLLAEAVNTKDHVSIGRAFVDVPPPMEKTEINRYTRWLTRKLMEDMTASWLSPEPGNARESSAPPATQPEK
jgi:hypothetical protein